MCFFKLITKLWGNFEEYRWCTSWLCVLTTIHSIKCMQQMYCECENFCNLCYCGTDVQWYWLLEKKDFRLLCLYQWVYAHWYFVTMSVALYCSQYKKKKKEKKKHVNMKKMKLSMTDIEVMRTNNNWRNDYNCHLSFVVHVYPQQ